MIQYNDLKKVPYCDLRFGVIFYFYKDPVNHKREIIDIFEEYCEITQEEFTYYRYERDEGLEKSKKNVKKFFIDIIEKSSFESSERILLTNAERDKVQDIKVEMSMTNLNPAYPVRLPNWIYFEFLPTVEFDEIFHFIKHTCLEMEFQYCCGNFVVGANDHYSNRSYSSAVKLMRETKCVSDSYSVWENPSFRRKLETGICEPYMIQVLSSTLYEKIGHDKLVEEFIMYEKEYGLYLEPGEEYIIISTSKDTYPKSDEECIKQYKILKKMFSDIIIDIKKPLMYWKSDEWEKWKNRFND